MTGGFAALAARVRAHLQQDHRYAHCVRVARCAELLAMRHGADVAAARMAGMLHDLARLYSTAQLMHECIKRDMPIDDFERAHPIVLHARLGARLAQESFGVDDPSILSAIEKHTVAAADMSLLDCIVYLADGLEPGRIYPEREQLWNLAMHDVRAAMRATLASSTSFLISRGDSVAPQTLAAVEAFSAPQEAEPSLS